MSELKLCPFCGYKTSVEHDDFGEWVRCINTNCALVGLTMIVDCWNTRPLEDALQDELEQLRVQLAGCGVAALGGTSNEVLARQGDYGWSPSYQDILELRQKYDALQAKLDEANKELTTTEGIRLSQLHSVMRDLHMLKANYDDQENTIKVLRKSRDELQAKLDIAVEALKIYQELEKVFNDDNELKYKIATNSLKKLEETK